MRTIAASRLAPLLLALLTVIACVAEQTNGGGSQCEGAKCDEHSAGEPLQWSNPVIPAEEGGVADPGVFKASDGRYYMASTGGSRGWYPIRVSDDLVECNGEGGLGGIYSDWHGEGRDRWQGSRSSLRV